MKLWEAFESYESVTHDEWIDMAHKYGEPIPYLIISDANEKQDDRLTIVQGSDFQEWNVDSRLVLSNGWSGYEPIEEEEVEPFLIPVTICGKKPTISEVETDDGSVWVVNFELAWAGSTRTEAVRQYNDFANRINERCQQR